MQAIDVVMITKNSQHLLHKCLDSLYKNVPVNRLIVVDGYSTDATKEIFQAFNSRFGNVTFISANGTRAKAREKGIAQVTTDWFMFLDSDIILSEGWYSRAQKSVASDVGAIWGVNIDVIPQLNDRRFVNLQHIVAKRCFALRGGTHDTLIRRDVVKHIRIPEELHTHEDAYIMKYIKRRGYSVVVGEDIYCLHYKPPESWGVQKAVSEAILELRCGLVQSRNFAYIAYYPIFIFYWSAQMFQKIRRLFPGQSLPKMV